MQPTIGAALSRGIINDFIVASHREYGFYNQLEQLAKRYSATEKNSEKIRAETNNMVKSLEKLKKELAKKMRPFNYQTRAKIAEEIAKVERSERK